MVPQPRDVVQLVQQIRWFLGAGPQPRFEHFTYWEKFDYWAVLWGTLLMGAAGLILWFPQAASRVLPGWMFNVALFVHGAEATLAIGFIFVIHFFNGHLRPGKFPMDLVIFTGSVSGDELREERAGRVRAAGRDRRAGRTGRPAAVGRAVHAGTSHRHGRAYHRPGAGRAHSVRGSSLIGETICPTMPDANGAPDPQSAVDRGHGADDDQRRRVPGGVPRRPVRHAHQPVHRDRLLPDSARHLRLRPAPDSARRLDRAPAPRRREEAVRAAVAAHRSEQSRITAAPPSRSSR